MKKQRFSDRRPVWGLLLWTYGAFLISEFLVGMISAFLLPKAGLDRGTATALGSCIGAILVLLFWYLRNRPAYRFLPRKGEIGGSFRLMLVPMLLFWIVLFGSYAYFVKGFPFAPIGLREILMACMAGLVEEICFREIALSFMARHWMTEKRIPLFAVISGVLFGVTHITNAIGGMSIADACYQVILCIFFGVFFSAVYLRKGNVWIPCLFHVVHDILAFSGAAVFTLHGIDEIPDWSTMLIAAAEFGLCLYGFFFLLRKAKRQEIIDLWAYKWGGAPAQPAGPSADSAE